MLVIKDEGLKQLQWKRYLKGHTNQIIWIIKSEWGFELVIYTGEIEDLSSILGNLQKTQFKAVTSLDSLEKDLRFMAELLFKDIFSPSEKLAALKEYLPDYFNKKTHCNDVSPMVKTSINNTLRANPNSFFVDIILLP